jgi:Tfp pilus assembly protein PilV
MWFLTAGLLFFALKNPRSTREAETFALGTTATLEPEQAMPMEQKDLQTVQNADGTTTQTTTTTIVNADGSKTVTRTTETIAADEAA